MTQEEMNEKEEKKEEKKQQTERDAANNAQALRVAASVAEKSGNPYAMAAGKIVNVADKVTGGRSTHLLGKTLAKSNNSNPIGKKSQKMINKTMESGAGQAAGMLASKKMDANNAAKNAENAKKAKEAADNAKKAKEAKEAADKAKKTKEVAENAKKAKDAKQASENSKTPAAGSDSEEKGKGLGGLIGAIAGIVGVLLLMIVGVVIFVPLIVIAPLLAFSNTNSSANSNPNTLNQVTIKNTTGYKYDGVVTMDEYIAGVLAAEDHPVNNLQYYKFLALKHRTFYYAEKDSNNVINLFGKGNSYIPVDESDHETTILRAVNDTSEHFIYTEDEDINKNTITTDVTKDGDGNYNIKYNSPYMDSAKTKTISKDWRYIDKYKSKLNSIFTSDDQIVNILTLYLITEEGYDYTAVVNEYYKNADIVAGFSMAPTGREVNGYIPPVANYACSSGYGCREKPIGEGHGMHYGIDLAAAEGENVYATKSGTIANVITNVPGYSTTITEGNSIIINHDDGSQTRYYHLAYNSIPSSITVGARVEQGDKIGEVGSTGKSTGPHLHYEIIISGRHVNPYHYMDTSFAGNDGLMCNNNAILPESLCKE